MIRAERQKEPSGFDEKVRQPGRRAIAELLGMEGLAPRKGRPRKALPVADLTVEHLHPYWREGCLNDMHQLYAGICAYLCIYIPRGGGSPTVDHFLGRNACVQKAKRARTPRGAARALEPVYEWNNYRLASGLMNSRKGEYSDVLDPFEIEDSWFSLVFPSLEVQPTPGLPQDLRARVQATIDRLKLNDPECCNARAEYFDEYIQAEDPVPLSFLERRSPFVARELRRQGLLKPGDK